ncbi:unnamed protein product [Diabrotica balteata]|uniref:tRNA-splicing endonuclease subunit Sen54 N-terminal domain-containing protein n=1 Tax=Diabrotica balteata TaxID=107213 RepID=A0A9N9SRQ5_DIABA|nr:unnamed protein product [Diabrotica balteata]CAH1274791.1 unnamed protein product [Diabrotica balteata]
MYDLPVEEEAKVIVNDHKHPLTKINFLGPKQFFKDTSRERQELVTKNLQVLEFALKHKKVDKRCARAKAEWIASLKLAKVEKVVKGLLETFGYQDKSGIYVYPEEMLYLVEMNKMEVFVNNVPLTVQECFDVVLNVPNMTLTKYQAYKKLVLQGNRVIRYSEVVRKRNNGKIPKENSKICDTDTRKRKLEDENDEVQEKRIRSEDLDDSETDERAGEYIRGIFEKLRNSCPKEYSSKEALETSPDYCVFIKNNSSRVEWDFNLYICESDAINYTNTNSTKPELFAICSGDNIAFYRMGQVYLPHL